MYFPDVCTKTPRFTKSLATKKIAQKAENALSDKLQMWRFQKIKKLRSTIFFNRSYHLVLSPLTKPEMADSHASP